MYKPVKELIDSLSYLPEAYPHGWMQGCNIRVLDMFISKGTNCIIELGSWLGESAIYMSKQAPHAKIYCIDLLFASENSDMAMTFLLQYCPGIRHRLFKDDDFYSLFLSNIDEYSDPRRIYAVPKKTVRGMLDLYDLGIKPDLIYIDADHSYQAVLDDLEACKTLFPEAQLVGDDWNRASVKDALRQQFPRNKIKNIDNCWWVDK
jgi:hypothetical protein